jgi:hypothetical protein
MHNINFPASPVRGNSPCGNPAIFADDSAFLRQCPVVTQNTSLESVHTYAAGRLSVLARAHVPNVKEDEWRGNSPHSRTISISLMPY